MPVESPAKKLEEYIPAMLAKETDTPFSKEDWIYEIKWDGYRAIAEVNKAAVKLYSRNGNSFLSAYPEVVEELSKMKLNAVLDGEIVVLNEEGNPDFQKLQYYGMNKDFPLQYYVFDLLELNGKKLYSTPLIERKKLLAEIIKNNAVIKYSDHIEESGEDFFEVIKEKNLEGIMAKRKDSEYYPGKRTAGWLKIKHHKSEDAIIAGFTEPRGGRKYFGALILGTMVNGTLTYAGHTGSGFDTNLLKEMYAKLQPTIRETSPFNEKVKTNMPVTWVEPLYVCEVKFSEWTSDGKLRHPIFLSLREDKTAKEVSIQPQNIKEVEEDNTVAIATETPEEKPKKKASSQKKSSVKENSKMSKIQKISSEEKHLKKEDSANKVPKKDISKENVPSKEKPSKLVESKKNKRRKKYKAPRGGK